MPGILVVEDDENLNRGITFSLKKSGYEVFSAESMKKAKRIASDNNVDVTICDVNLPDGNGLEFYSLSFKRLFTLSPGNLSSMSIISNKFRGNSFSPIRVRYSLIALRSIIIFP